MAEITITVDQRTADALSRAVRALDSENTTLAKWGLFSFDLTRDSMRLQSLREEIEDKLKVAA